MRWDISLLQSQTLLFKVGFLSSHHHTHHQSDLSDNHLDHHQWDAKLLWPIFAIIFDTSFATTKKVHNRFRFLSPNSTAGHPPPWTDPSKIFTTKRLRVQRGQVLPLRKSMVRIIAIQHQHHWLARVVWCLIAWHAMQLSEPSWSWYAARCKNIYFGCVKVWEQIWCILVSHRRERLD